MTSLENSENAPDSVVFPWSTCARMQKFLQYSGDTGWNTRDGTSRKCSTMRRAGTWINCIVAADHKFKMRPFSPDAIPTGLKLPDFLDGNFHCHGLHREFFGQRARQHLDSIPLIEIWLPKSLAKSCGRNRSQNAPFLEIGQRTHGGVDLVSSWKQQACQNNLLCLNGGALCCCSSRCFWWRNTGFRHVVFGAKASK